MNGYRNNLCGFAKNRITQLIVNKQIPVGYKAFPESEVILTYDCQVYNQNVLHLYFVDP